MKLATAEQLVNAYHLPLLNAQGKTALVDSIDSDLSVDNWSYGVGKATKKYVVRTRYDDHAYLHRVIMERILGRRLWGSEQVRFRNGNTLDCRRHNLLLHFRRSSKYQGVTRLKNGKFSSFIFDSGKTRYLGTYETEEEAHQVFIIEAKKLGRELKAPIVLPEMPELSEERKKIRALIKPLPKD